MKFTLQQLVDIECIKQLKYRYMRAIDTRDIPLLTECLMPDVRASYSNGTDVFTGAAAIIDYVPEVLGGTGSSHEASHPEIAFVDDTHATGIWRLTDTVHYVKARPRIAAVPGEITGEEVLTSAAHYFEEYTCLDGEWKIQSLEYLLLWRHVGPRVGTINVWNDTDGARKA